MEFITVQKYIRTSPLKLRLVADMVRTLKPVDALEQLPFSGKKAAEPFSKALKTVIANAVQKGVSDKDLVFKEIQINQGPKLKRWRAGARGRAKPYERIMSHIRIVLTTEVVNEKKVDSKRNEVKTEVEKSKVKNQKLKSKRENVKSVNTERRK
jgi:large subunit ribosomal protein L22